MPSEEQGSHQKNKSDQKDPASVEPKKDIHKAPEKEKGKKLTAKDLKDKITDGDPSQKKDRQAE